MKVDVIHAQAFKLEPGEKYLVCLDSRYVTEEAVVSLMKGFRRIGITQGLAWMINGDPNKIVKIVEQEL